MVLAEFKFGHLNAQSHRRTCFKFKLVCWQFSINQQMKISTSLSLKEVIGLYVDSRKSAIHIHIQTNGKYILLDI